MKIIPLKILAIEGNEPLIYKRLILDMLMAPRNIGQPMLGIRPHTLYEELMIAVPLKEKIERSEGDVLYLEEAEFNEIALRVKTYPFTKNCREVLEFIEDILNAKTAPDLKAVG